MTRLWEKFSLAIKKWQFCIGYQFSCILPYFQVAVVAQNCTILNSGSTPQFLRRYRNSVSLPNGEKFFSTPSTQDPITPACVYSSLSLLSSKNNSPHKPHNSPPLITWSLGRAGHDWFGYKNGVWTGLHIDKISSLLITNLQLTDFRVIKLKHPSYHISFSPNAETQNICHLVATPTLNEAKELAEWYYAEWLSVNHNFDVEDKNLYPPAKRLEDRANGARLKAGNTGNN